MNESYRISFKITTELKKLIMSLITLLPLSEIYPLIWKAFGNMKRYYKIQIIVFGYLFTFHLKPALLFESEKHLKGCFYFSYDTNLKGCVYFPDLMLLKIKKWFGL